jgi:hypothetical protein
MDRILEGEFEERFVQENHIEYALERALEDQLVDAFEKAIERAPGFFSR